MTITMEITKSVLMGCPENTNVTVMDLRAAADEMPFVQALTKLVKDFASTFDAAKEGK